MFKLDRPLPPARRHLLAACWQAPLAAAGGLALAVLLGIAVLLLSGAAALHVAAHPTWSNPGLVALSPWLGLGLATLTGSVAGISVVAVLVRDLLAGQPPTLRRSWGRTWTSLAPVLTGVLALLAGALLAGLAALPLALFFLLRCGWLLRTRGRGAALRGLWLAVPGAGAVAVTLAVPVTWAALLAGRPLRPAITGALRHHGRGRLGVLGGLLGVTAVVLGLTWAGAHWVDQPATWSGVRPLLALGVLELTVLGTALGWLGHRRGERPTRAPFPGAPAVRPRRAGWWGQRRLAAVATLAAGSLLLPLAPGLLLASAQAAGSLSLASALDPNAVFVVDTLADPATPGPDDCVDPAAPCGIRAALAQAAQLAAAGGSPRVEFAVSGTITLTDTLMVPSGITVDAGGQQVTLDAHHDVRALVVFTAQQSEGASVTLRGFTVTGGRSVEGGAGLFSDATRVMLEQMTFTDNESGVGQPNQPDGGAVAVPYTSVSVDSSTFTDNRADAGVGGAVAGGYVRWQNSTSVHDLGVFGSPQGGAIYARYGGLVSHATLVDGGGVAGTDSSLLTVVNSAISVAEANFPCARINGADALGTETGNVDAEGTCLGTKAALAPIGTLDDNGGPTRTVALFPGSAAIGAGAPGQCADSDQRGESRNPDSCDAGAFQTSATDVPAVALTLDPLNELRVGEPVELVARLTSAAALPAGTVRFLDGTDVLAQDRPVVDDVARVQLPHLPQGVRSITAEFLPAAGAPNGTSDPLKVLVRAPVHSTLTAPAPVALHGPATITVHVAGDADEAGVPGPTGQVHFSAGSATHDATLVDGSAQWELPALETAYVTVTYDGDDAHQPDATSGPLTTEDLPTTTTAAVPHDTVPYGDPVVVNADVADTTGPAQGSVQLFVDGAAVTSGMPLRDGSAQLAAKLSAGLHSAYLVYAPDRGWATSRSATFPLTVAPASATVTIDPMDDRPYQASNTVAVRAVVTGAGRIGAVVRLLDGTRLLATATTDGAGAADLRFSSGLLELGPHTVVAEVVESATVAGARSAPQQFQVTKVPTQFYVSSAPPGWVGRPIDVTMTSLQGDLVGTVELRRSDDGTVLDRSAIDGTTATVSFTPTAAVTYALDVVFIPDDQDPVMHHYAITTQPTAATVARGYLPTPTVSWAVTPVPGPTTLTVDFGDVTPAPTGMVTLTDPYRGTIATAWLDHGHAELVPGGALGGSCLCGGLRVQYSGDDSWRPQAAFAPDVTIPSWPTTTALGDLPSTIGRGETLHLSATVSSVFLIPSGEVTFSVDGVPLPPVTVERGIARTTYTATVAGDHRISATYLPPTGLYTPSTSPTSTVTVSLAPEPTMTLSGPTDGRPLLVGSEATFTASASTGSWLIPPGSSVTVVDDHGTVLGSTPWAGQGPFSPATIHVTPAHGGPQTFRALFDFDGDRHGSSAPLAVIVAARTPLLVEPVDTRAQIGSPFRVAVSLDQQALTELGMAPQRVEVTLRNYSEAVGDPVILDAGNNFRATVTLDPATRTDLVLNADTEGNADAGLARGQSAAVTVTVHGLLAVPTATGPDRVVQGDPFTAQVSVPNPFGNAPDPSGYASVSLRDNTGHDVASCEVQLPAVSCEANTLAAPPGRYTVLVTYHGDDVYEPQTNSAGQVLVVANTSRLELAGVDTRSGWLVGDRVSLTWRTYDPRFTDGDGTETTNPGRVHVSLGTTGLVCDVPASDGGCTFTVPDYGGTLRDAGRYTQLEAAYLPASATPAAQVTLPVFTPAHCRSVTVENDIDGHSPADPTISGTPCKVGAVEGYVEGTRVTVTRHAPAPANFTFAGWETGGQYGQSSPEPDVVIFTVNDNARVRARFDWAPQCATIRIVDEDGHPLFGRGWRDPGYLDLVTPSNCAAGAFGESADERSDRWKGIGHYIVGTSVDLAVRQPYTAGTVADPAYTMAGIPGADPADDTHPLAHLTAAADVALYPQWRPAAAMCTRVRLYAGDGGTLALTGATVPTTYLHPTQDGSCQTASGAPGLLAGTKAQLTATPATTGPEAPSVDRWWGESDFAESDAARADPARHAEAKNLDERPIGTPQPSVPVTHTETIPQTPGDVGTRFGVAFAKVDCVPVAVEVRVPGDHGRPPTSSWPASNCPARDSTTTPDETWVPLAGRVASMAQTRVQTTTVWYVRGTRIDVGVNAAWHPWGDASSFYNTDPYTLAPRWSAAVNATFEAAVTPASSTSDGVSRVALRTDRPMWLRATYVPTGCGLPHVSVTPAGHSWTWDPAKSSGLCPDTQIDPTRGISLTADPGGNQTPVWSVAWDRWPAGWIGSDNPRTGSKGTTYLGRTFDYGERSYTHSARVHLSYCTPLKVSVEPVWADGQPLSPADLTMTKASGNPWSGDPLTYLDDEGGCPASLMGLESSAQRVGLTDAANQQWVRVSATLNGQPVAEGQNPVLRVDADGTTSDEARFKLTPRCFELTWSDWVDIDTPSNCPGHGSDRWFLAGTAVAVHYHGDHNRKFTSWDNVDASDGGNAVVIMNDTRHPVAHWDKLAWYDEAGNFFSSLAQRTLAALTTLAMAVAGKVLLVGNVASLLMGGIAAGLEAVGAGGAVADGFRYGSQAVNAGVDLATATTSCISLWATGGASPLVPSTVNLVNSGIGGAATAGGMVARRAQGGLGSGSSAAGAVGSATKAVANVINVVNAFGAGPDAYFSDARAAWSGVGAIGTCVEPAFNDLDKATG